MDGWQHYVVMGLIAIVGYFVKRELTQISKAIDHFDKRVTHLEEGQSRHDTRLAVIDSVMERRASLR